MRTVRLSEASMLRAILMVCVKRYRSIAVRAFWRPWLGCRRLFLMAKQIKMAAVMMVVL
ncbi:MAG: hypothetical protein QW282_05995 [Nitrososphaerales archaeon]